MGKGFRARGLGFRVASQRVETCASNKGLWVLTYQSRIPGRTLLLVVEWRGWGGGGKACASRC